MRTEDDALVRLTATEEYYLRTALDLLIDEKGEGLAELVDLDPAAPGRDIAIGAITEQIDSVRRLSTRLKNAFAVLIIPTPED